MPSAGRQSTPSRPATRPSAQRRSAREDIPLAQRTLSPSLRPRRTGRLLAIGAGSMLLLAGALALVFPQPIRQALAPDPLPGLRARPTADGRLLGHFPYGEAAGAELVTIAPGMQLQRDAADALLAMQAAAAADGIELRVLSAFRSIALQKRVFFDVKSERNQSASDRARVSAPPGYSEHSTGYAVDLGDGRRPQSDLSASFADTAAFAWLRRHANRFHFHLSFPENNPQGVSYEPWHWRFEGSAEALQTFQAAQRLQR